MAPILLDTVLAIQIMSAPQANLEEKNNPITFKDEFPVLLF